MAGLRGVTAPAELLFALYNSHFTGYTPNCKLLLAIFLKGVEIAATEELLSVPEVGDRLGVSVYTVRRWIKSGDLAAYRPGKEYRVRESDLEKFLEAHGPKVTAPQPKSRAAAQPLEWQEGLAEAYRAAAEEGRAALRTPRPDFERVRVFHDFVAGLARARGSRDILGRESDALADAIAEVEDVDDQVQVRIQEWFAEAPEEDQRPALEQIRDTKYEKVLGADAG